MSMCNQTKTDTSEHVDLLRAFFENGIRQPRIDEQNFSARRYDLESRLAIPGELRVHGNHQTEKDWFGKGDEHGALRHPATDVSSFVINSAFDIRHSSFLFTLALYGPRFRPPTSQCERNTRGRTHSAFTAI